MNSIKTSSSIGLTLSSYSFQQNLIKTCRYLLAQWNENRLNNLTVVENTNSTSTIASAIASTSSPPSGFKQQLDTLGPQAFAQLIRGIKKPLLTDTTLRDAHQSLLATRLRTYDILNASSIYANRFSNLFSLEMWGGATFDVALRFLHEDPWTRVRQLRSEIPNIPFQMLLRGTNAVGYKEYPNACCQNHVVNAEELLNEFCKEAVISGIDIFRIFDALNDFDNLQRGIDAVGNAGGVIEGAVCYTTDAPRYQQRSSLERYTQEYFLNVARYLIESNIHILAIKDMAGLLTPRSVTQLIESIRYDYPNIPIHIHMHDSAGTGITTLTSAINAGADIVDVAIDSLSGLTSQPSMGSLLACLNQDGDNIPIRRDDVSQLNNYFRDIRQFYSLFDCGPIISSIDPDVFYHQIPGGQLSNLHVQSKNVGNDWKDIVKAYSLANSILDDPIKVTPTSKAVGDFAQILVSMNLMNEDEQTIINIADSLNLPESVIDYLNGKMGNPPFGYPEEFRDKVLSRIKENKKNTIQDNDQNCVIIDWDEIHRTLYTVSNSFPEDTKYKISRTDLISYCLFPNVFMDFLQNWYQYGPYIPYLPTQFFFNGLSPGQTVELKIPNDSTITITRRHNFPLEFKINDNDLIRFTQNNHQLIASYEKWKPTESVDNSLRQFHAPINGSITNIHINSGSLLTPRMPLITMKLLETDSSPELVLLSSSKILVSSICHGDCVREHQILFHYSDVNR